MNESRIISKIGRISSNNEAMAFDYLKTNFLKKANNTKINLFKSDAGIESELGSGDIYQKILDDLMN